MNRADMKKNQFKSKVAKVFREYRPFIIGCGVGLVILVVGHIIGVARETLSYQWDINTVVEGDYVAEIKGEEEPFIVVHGDLEPNDLMQIKNAVSARESMELPLYLMEEGYTVDERIDYFAPNLLARIEAVDERYEYMAFTTYPEVGANIAAVNDWDIFTEESVFENNGLTLKGYIDPEASSVDVIAQLNGLNEATSNLNEDNESAEYSYVLYEFQHGDDQIRHHSDYAHVLGRVTLYQRTRSGDSN